MAHEWMSSIAILSLSVGCCCAALIAIDELWHPQRMAVMSIVWPITGLYGGLIAVWAYFRWGRRVGARENCGMHPAGRTKSSAAAQYAMATTHCGSGCTLGDLVAEWLIYFVPSVLIVFGYRSLFADKIFAGWVLDFILAFAFGMVFQFFTIAPKRHLSLGRGIIAALKADAFSLLAWQIGMYGWMAVVTFVVFGHELSKRDPVFWFMMQIAMICGFATSYPVNAWLITQGLKEKM